MMTEPRIASLLDDPLLNDSSINEPAPFAIAPLYNPTPSEHVKKPLPVEPSNIGKDKEPSGVGIRQCGTLGTLPLPKETSPVIPTPSQAQPALPPLGEVQASSTASKGNKSAVPLAGVLNSEEPDNDTRPRKRRKASVPEPAEFVTLPKPNPQVKKAVKRPRIPPLLQGLHQPPPDAGLFPPIREHHSPQLHYLPLSQAGDTHSIPDKALSRGSRNDEVSIPSAAAPTNSAVDAAISKPASNTPGSGTGPSGRAPFKAKRNKWTEQETLELLKGVQKHGIGCWKEILNDGAFKFSHRNAVDLKDRFRTVRPDDCSNLPKSTRKATKGLKATTPLRKAASSTRPQPQSSLIISNILHQESSSSVSADAAPPKRRRRGRKTDRVDEETLASLGIEEPFRKSTRRERHEFTEKEDQALLEGIEKWGTSWISIQQDTSLRLDHRKPGDLRDRFRNKYADLYEDAGFKLPNKISRKLQVEKEKATQVAAEANVTTIQEGRSLDSNRVSQSETNTPRKQQLPLKLLQTNFLDSFLSDTSASGEEDASPVILDRSIFDWANAQLPSNSSNNALPVSDTATLLPKALVVPPRLDALHIDPRLTQNPPALSGIRPLQSASSALLLPSMTTAVSLLAAPNLHSIVAANNVLAHAPPKIPNMSNISSILRTDPSITSNPLPLVGNNIGQLSTASKGPVPILPPASALLSAPLGSFASLTLPSMETGEAEQRPESGSSASLPSLQAQLDEIAQRSFPVPALLS